MKPFKNSVVYMTQWLVGATIIGVIVFIIYYKRDFK
jgi:hypothetical protein